MSRFTSAINAGKQIIGHQKRRSVFGSTSKQNASAAARLAYPEEADDNLEDDVFAQADNLARVQRHPVDTLKRVRENAPVRSFDCIPNTSALPYVGALWQYKFGEYCFRFNFAFISSTWFINYYLYFIG